MTVAERPLARMQARTSITNRSHPGITHPARSRLTTSWPPQPGPSAVSAAAYCNQPSFVSGGEAEGPWYVGDGQLCSSSRGKSCFFCSSPQHAEEDHRLVPPSSIITFAASTISKGHEPARLPSCRPAVELQRESYTTRVLEIDANHPTSPALCGLSHELTSSKPSNPVLSRR